MLHAVAMPIPRTSHAGTKDRLLSIIKQKSLLTTGGPFKLASGALSNFYLDMKPTTFDPEGSTLIAEIILSILSDYQADLIGGLELGAVPVISAVTRSSWPDRPIAGFVVRKEKKGHGTDKKIDGNFRENCNVVLFDDVTTTGGSVLQAVNAVREKGSDVSTVITVVDRLEGAKENLAKHGIDLVPIFTARDLLDS